MKYSIQWVDATLKENWEELRKSDKNIKYTLDNEASDGWMEFTAEHTFTATNDRNAKNYAQNYEFGWRDIEIWSLYKGNEVIMTEEDL